MFLIGVSLSASHRVVAGHWHHGQPRVAPLAAFLLDNRILSPWPIPSEFRVRISFVKFLFSYKDVRCFAGCSICPPSDPLGSSSTAGTVEQQSWSCRPRGRMADARATPLAARCARAGPRWDAVRVASSRRHYQVSSWHASLQRRLSLLGEFLRKYDPRLNVG